MSRVEIAAFPKERSHTLHFLDAARATAPVFLNTEVEMTQVEALRNLARQATGHQPSYVTVLTRILSEVVGKYPEANATLRTFPFARVACHQQVSAKITFDKQWNGRRVVMAAVLPQADRLPLSVIQNQVHALRDAPIEQEPAFAGIRLLNRLPIWLGRLLYRLIMWGFVPRESLQGTFTITSLGHRGVQAFFPQSASTLCFGVGAVEQKPVCRGGAVTIRPMMTLNLVFDHRVIDGALAADLLSEIKERLEDPEIMRLLEEEGVPCEKRAGGQ